MSAPPAAPSRAPLLAAPDVPAPAPPPRRRALLPALATVLLLALPGERWSVAGGQVAPADLASLLLAGCGLALLARPGPRLRPAAAVLLAAPAAAFALTTMASADPAGSLPGFARCLQVFVLVPLAVVLLLRDRRDFRLLALAVLALALAQGALGTWQHRTGNGASYLGENVRAVGTFGPMNVMGMATVVSLGLVLALALGLAPPAHASRLRRPAALGCAALLAVPLAFSFSRGAWLATGAAVCAVLLLAGRRPVRTLLAVTALAALAGGGVAAFGPGMLQERIGSIGQVTGSGADQSVTDRYAMWDAAVSMWRDAPWTGTGPKGYAGHRDAHASLALSGGSDTGGAGHAFRRQELQSPHNMYLLLLSEQGLIGAGTAVCCWAALLACAVRRLRAARRSDVGLAATGLLVWHAVNFLYADIGGPHTVLTGIAFGLTAWWALSPAAVAERAP
ncbi:O-antigen ligase family protein [Streptomyces sp. DSM 44917]|uniref:O-antigen ligase family protein n=1 Tax=Streptomyces boetiae TaxID=3075541 RepID=A0ABU2LGG0_9ACTN|nr:O-antigen ligase family protein [Streptomyces sp. DSM 44917]MDT0310666.1 O-antigen ligase family protein [Streptomyces sp. DSM 44917]